MNTEKNKSATLSGEEITEETSQDSLQDNLQDNPAVKNGQIDLTQYQTHTPGSHSLPKRIAAWICIIILGCMYLSTLIMAIAGVSIYNKFFIASLIGTLVVPLFSFVVVWLIGRNTGRKVMGDPETPEK